MKTPTLNSANYYINYYGQVIDIKPTKDLLILQFACTGSGDQSVYCSFRTTYEVYQVSGVSGKELKLVGMIYETSGTEGSKFHGTILEQKIELNGVTADQVFKKIFKRK